jgi:hypothetical protein
MSDKGMRDEPQRQPATPQRDLYDYYQPNEGMPQVIAPQGDRMPAPRPEYAQPTQRFQEEYYQAQQQGYARRDAGAYRVPNGDNNINMVVYGDVYINQGDGVNSRGGNTYDYRQPGGQQYDYRQYCAPQREQPPVYYQGPHCRSGCGGSGGYQYYDGDTRGYYPQPVQRSGYEVYQRGPTYSNDDVSGGRDGYRSSRQRYDGGYTYQGQGGARGGYGGEYGTPPYVAQDNGMNQAGQVFDMVLRGADAYFGYDIARRYANNDRQQSRGNYGNGGYDNRGGGNQYGWNQSGGHYRVPPRNSQYYR